MPNIDKLIPGTFCWMELATTDQPKAKEFYSSLFGWTATDYPMGALGAYTIFTLNGRDCAAGYTLREEDRNNHVPSHWMLYIGVADADASTKLAAELGGKVLAGPFDVMDKGRMSVMQDPQGAYFCLWQAHTSNGIGIAGEPGAFCWADLSTPDRAAAKAFYGKLLGWTFDPGQGKDESGYLHITNGQIMIGGVPPSGMTPPGVPPHWLIYYQVANCDASFKKATGLGAQALMPPMTIEGAGIMSLLRDPQGAVFAIFQSTM